jgi:ATP-dependent exoDNAse (exonuclease V) alpha subunit
MIQLNQEQQQLKEKLNTFLASDNNGYFGVYGGGGTGKTFTICNTITNYKRKVLFLGATNKVTTVLKNGLESAGFKNPEIKTIDGFLKFKIKRDHENNQTISYSFPSKSQIPSLIVIDEISLISYSKFKLLEQLKEHCKLILLGDYLQLPPIEEEKQNIVRNSDGFQVSLSLIHI